MEMRHKIRALRGDRSQADFAELVGVDQSTVGRWEAGKLIPKTPSAGRLAALCGQSIEEFMETTSDDAEVAASHDAEPSPSQPGRHKKASSAAIGALDIQIAQVLMKSGVSDPERISEIISNLRELLSRRSL